MAVDGITRADADALFSEEVSPAVIQSAIKSSTVLSDFPRIDMGQKSHRLPVLSALPTGAFLAADQDVKPLSEFAWDKVMLTAEEIAVVIPISESVIADASTDVVAEATELIGQEFGRIIDAAAFFGTGAPASWPTGGLFGVANTAASPVQKVAATDKPDVDFNALFGILEGLERDPDRVYAAKAMKSLLRGQQAGTNGAVFEPTQSGNSYSNVYGVPLGYPLGWDAAKADAIAVDTTGVALGLRQDITIKTLTEATLTGFGNLAEKDSVAIRAVMRVAFAVANPIEITSGKRAYPVAALTPKA